MNDENINGGNAGVTSGEGQGTDPIETGETGASEENATGDAGVDTGVAPTATADEEVALFKILGDIEIKDAQGTVQGHYVVGSETRFPISVGEIYVADGRAERVQE